MPKPAQIKWDGVGWYSALAALLAFLVLLAVATAAYDLAQKVDKEVQRTALANLAREAPLAICPNATMEGVRGKVSSQMRIFVGVFDDTINCRRTKSWPVSKFVNDDHEHDFAFKLHKCGVLRAWYYKGDLQNYFKRPASQPFLDFLHEWVNFSSIDPVRDPVLAQVPGHLTQDDPEGGELSNNNTKQVTHSSDYYIQDGSNVIKHDMAPPHLQKGIWVLYNTIKGRQIPLMWLVFTQTHDTAACLATVFNTSGLERQGVPDGVDTWYCNGSRRVWFNAEVLVPYFCMRGVLGSDQQRLDAHIQFAKATTRFSFLGIPNQGYDDVYALYTAAMGAVFGAWATLLGILAAVLVAACWNGALCLSAHARELPITCVPSVQRNLTCSCSCNRMREVVRRWYNRVCSVQA